MAGIFLVVEGPEGAGKTTLARGLARRLRSVGIDPVEVREPGGTPVAEAARQVVLDPELETGPVSELFLILAARADLVARIIQPALDAGRVVVSDRYDLSTEAYQIAGRGLDRDKVLQANAIATGGLEPDLMLVLDLPVHVGRARQGRQGKEPDRLERAEEAMHERVTDFFAGLTGAEVVHLDAMREREIVEEAAWAEVIARFGETIGAHAG